MSVRRWIALAAATSIVAAALSLGLASTAHAGSPSCPSARLCFYVGGDWRGLFGSRSALTSGERLENVSLDYNDEMSSWENKTRNDARWYFAENGGGTALCMGQNAESRNVGLVFNDQMSSYRRYSVTIQVTRSRVVSTGDR